MLNNKLFLSHVIAFPLTSPGSQNTSFQNNRVAIYCWILAITSGSILAGISLCLELNRLILCQYFQLPGVPIDVLVSVFISRSKPLCILRGYRGYMMFVMTPVQLIVLLGFMGLLRCTRCTFLALRLASFGIRSELRSLLQIGHKSYSYQFHLLKMRIMYWLIRRKATIQTPGQTSPTKRDMKNISLATFSQQIFCKISGR